MKYFIAGILLICLVLAFCVFNITYENRWLGEIQSRLEDAQRCAGAEMHDAALAYTNAAYTIWTERSSYFAAVLVHDDVDELSRAFELALDTLSRASDSAADAVTETLSVVNTIIDSEQFSLRNIF